MNKASILIVEDESIVALDIKDALEAYNYKVTDIAFNAKTALTKIEIKLPDIIIMDINLGEGKDGIETAKKIQSKYNIPIIYLTAFSNEDIMQKAIETNPLGYIIKPFKGEDLNATIQLALYKMKDSTKKIDIKNRFNLGGNYYFNRYEEKLFFNKHPIKLSKNETELLKLLIEAKGNAISYSDIEYNIWPDSAINYDTLRALVYRLRTKLNYNFIETVAAYGYKLETYK